MSATGDFGTTQPAVILACRSSLSAIQTALSQWTTANCQLLAEKLGKGNERRRKWAVADMKTDWNTIYPFEKK